MFATLYDKGTSTPQRLRGGWIVPLKFSGPGRARFRLQHTSDRNGAPDDLGWSDVTLVSDASARPHAAINSDSTVSGVLVDWVEGLLQVFYRRFRAEWLRVVPHQQDDEECLQSCAAFFVTMEV